MIIRTFLYLSILLMIFKIRFELQSNENKRLQNHIASLKSDNHLLKKKLVRIPLLCEYNNYLTSFDILANNHGTVTKITIRIW
jgi:hypothetical protein